MARSVFIILCVLVAVACRTSQDRTIGIHIKGISADEAFVFETADSVYNVMLDSMGAAKIVLARDAKAGYAVLAGGGMRMSVYVEPGKNFDVMLEVNGKEAIAEFSGEGARKNEYLNSKIFTAFQPDFSLEESAFIDSLGKQVDRYWANLDSLKFNEPFAGIERQRLDYAVFSALTSYPSYHQRYVDADSFSLSSEYYSCLRSRIKEDETLLGVEEYRNALADFVTICSTKELQHADDLQVLRSRLDFVNRYMGNSAVSSFLVDRFATEYIAEKGIDHLNEISRTYDAKVSDPALKVKFDALCAKWQRISAGQQVPGFSFPDIDGNEISQKDLSGKYVLITIWASWCPSCKKELAALRELEKQFAGKNIVFAGISCDPDKAAWEQMMRDNAPGGIQLYMGEDRDYLSVFMVRSIPRFVLIDKEGKIVSSDVAGPSTSGTLEMLNALEGINPEVEEQETEAGLISGTR